MKKMKNKVLFLGMMVASLAMAACAGNGGSTSKKPSGSKSSSSEVSTSKVELPKFEVKIDSGNGDPKVEQIELGSALTKPADPTAPAGKVFYGWMNVKNGGQIWDFENRDNNAVMEDIELKPCFVPAGQQAQAFEAELCPDITERIGKDGTPGMDGETYSGGQAGTGLIARVNYSKETKTNKYNASGAFVREDGVARYATAADFDNPDVTVMAAFVHYNYVEGNTLTWELESDAAAENVTLFMRLSGEYGLPETNQVFEGEGEERVYETFNYEGFPVKVNDAPVNYGSITIHNIIPKTFLPFQDYMVSANVSLKAGKNTIQMVVNNLDTLNGTIKSTGPVVDAIKLYSSSNITWPKAKISQMDNSNK